MVTVIQRPNKMAALAGILGNLGQDLNRYEEQKYQRRMDERKMKGDEEERKLRFQEFLQRLKNQEANRGLDVTREGRLLGEPGMIEQGMAGFYGAMGQSPFRPAGPDANMTPDPNYYQNLAANIDMAPNVAESLPDAWMGLGPTMRPQLGPTEANALSRWGESMSPTSRENYMPATIAGNFAQQQAMIQAAEQEAARLEATREILEQDKIKTEIEKNRLAAAKDRAELEGRPAQPSRLTAKQQLDTYLASKNEKVKIAEAEMNSMALDSTSPEFWDRVNDKPKPPPEHILVNKQYVPRDLYQRYARELREMNFARRMAGLIGDATQRDISYEDIYGLKSADVAGFDVDMSNAALLQRVKKAVALRQVAESAPDWWKALPDGDDKKNLLEKAQKTSWEAVDKQKGKVITKDIIRGYIQRAKGNVEEGKRLARADGYYVE